MPSSFVTLARCTPLGVAPGLACTTERALSSAFLNASGVEMSGCGAPSRTITLMPTLPSVPRGDALNVPAFTSPSIAPTGMKARSGISPAASFFWISEITA